MLPPAPGPTDTGINAIRIVHRHTFAPAAGGLTELADALFVDGKLNTIQGVAACPHSGAEV